MTDRERPCTFRWLRRLLLGAALLASGCARDRVLVPPVSPDEAGKQAVAEYDKNGDGLLDAKELERCPALKNSLKLIDTDGDGRLSAPEIGDRIASYQAGGVGLATISCTVTLDTKPLSGATVTLVPEKFLGPSIKSAAGVTDERGVVLPQAEGQPLPGIPFGYYRIEVSKKDAAGKETILARYNQQTVLGEEVAPGRWKQTGSMPLSLTSK